MKKRKQVIKLLENHLGVKPKYLGMPTCNYSLEFKNKLYTIDVSGNIIDDSGETVDLETLLALAENPDVVSQEESPEKLALSPSGVSDSPEETMELVAEEVEKSPVESEVTTEKDEVEHPVPGVTEPAEAPQEQELISYEISIPFGGHTGISLKNMLNMIFAKQTLILNSFGVEDIIIKETLIKALNNKQVQSVEDFKAVLEEVGVDSCPGIEFNFEDKMIYFKFIGKGVSQEELHAYTDFITLLNHTARTLRHASSKVTITDNEKFSFRVWLIRLGMKGSQYKTTRRILLERLQGDSAFRHSRPEKAIS